ncbi:MAG TPA: GNAT family N-acetyltransferase [Anaerolineales bacterium]|nr:GNAT family N-acetyltransferase [Anaerolineales bacterium]
METRVEDLPVIHNQIEHRFEIWIDGDRSELDYRLQGDAVIMYHTGVPTPLEGRGIAGRLTRAALEFAEAESLRVVPLCSYVSAYIRRHPQYAKLVR